MFLLPHFFCPLVLSSIPYLTLSFKISLFCCKPPLLYHSKRVFINEERSFGHPAFMSAIFNSTTFGKFERSCFKSTLPYAHENMDVLICSKVHGISSLHETLASPARQVLAAKNTSLADAHCKHIQEDFFFFFLMDEHIMLPQKQYSYHCPSIEYFKYY